MDPLSKKSLQCKEMNEEATFKLLDFSPSESHTPGFHPKLLLSSESVFLTPGEGSQTSLPSVLGQTLHAYRLLISLHYAYLPSKCILFLLESGRKVQGR